MWEGDYLGPYFQKWVDAFKIWLSEATNCRYHISWICYLDLYFSVGI